MLFEKSGLCTGNRTLPREWFRRLDRLKTAPLNCHRHEDDNEERSLKAEVSSLKILETSDLSLETLNKVMAGLSLIWRSAA